MVEVVPVGFSVSGAAAIIFASMFIAFGVWFTAASSSFDHVTEAQDLRTDAVVETKNTAVVVTEATYDDEEDQLRIVAQNTGSATLSLEATDLLVDGEYVSGWEADAAVEENTGTDLWIAEEELVVTVTVSAQPSRVKLVTQSGLAETAEVVEE